MAAQTIFALFYAVVAIVVLSDLIKPFSERCGKVWFVLISIPLILFTTLRPIGIMRDDSYYKNLLDWNNADYLSKVLSLRDPLYYAMTWILSLFTKNPEVLLFVAGFVLILKLVILFKLGESKRLILLFMYLSIYWQLHDLTQLRVSFSALFFLAFFYFKKKEKFIFSVSALSASALSHAQAVLNMFLLLKWPKFPHFFLIGFAISLTLLMLFRIRVEFENLYFVINYLLGNPGGADFNFELREAIRSYYLIMVDSRDKGYDLNGLSPPIIFVLSVAVYLNAIVSIKSDAYSRPLIQSATLSIVFAIFLSWLFSSYSDVQVRFYEYYFLAGLILISESSKSRVLYSAFGLSLAYFAKFNVKWQIWNLGVINSALAEIFFR